MAQQDCFLSQWDKVHVLGTKLPAGSLIIVGTLDAAAPTNIEDKY